MGILKPVKVLIFKEAVPAFNVVSSNVVKEDALLRPYKCSPLPVFGVTIGNLAEENTLLRPYKCNRPPRLKRGVRLCYYAYVDDEFPSC